MNPRNDHKLDRRLGRVRCSCLVVAADEDRIPPRAHAKRYADLPPARLVTVPHAGHRVVLSAHAEVAAALADVIGGR